MGEWISAESGELLPNGKVKAKLGSGLCYRPGWHVSQIPLASHIGIKKNGVIVARHPDTVWCEVEYSDKIDYQQEANGVNSQGRMVASRAYLKHIPIDGYYRSKTNPNMQGTWIIAGSIKVNRILSEEEVIAICSYNGYEAQPMAV